MEQDAMPAPQQELSQKALTLKQKALTLKQQTQRRVVAGSGNHQRRGGGDHPEHCQKLGLCGRT